MTTMITSSGSGVTLLCFTFACWLTQTVMNTEPPQNRAFFHINSSHALQSHTYRTRPSYHLRARSRHMTLINKTKFPNNNDISERMLYTYSYLLYCNCIVLYSCSYQRVLNRYVTLCYESHVSSNVKRTKCDKLKLEK